nr:metacestode specific membrane protein 1 [Hymenolepis microstoma]
MDPLEPPLISKYEWEYKNDINQQMRVPDKLSVATSLPNLDSSKDNGDDVDHKENDAASIEHHQTTPGYSPDLLTDNEAKSYLPTSKAHDAVDASVTTFNKSQISETRTLVSRRNPVDRLRIAENRLNNLEIHVARLTSRLHSLEQQQAILGGISRSMGFPTERLPISPTEADFAKKERFRRNLKIIFIVFCLFTLAFLTPGIYLAVHHGSHTAHLSILGYVLIALGNVALITSIVSGNLFFRLVYTISESKIYFPKQADQLRSKPYPRQPGGVRLRRVPIIRTNEETEHPPPARKPPRISVRSSVETDSRDVNIFPIPSAPSEEIVSNQSINYPTLNNGSPMPSTSFAFQDRLRNNVEEDELEIAKFKRSPKAPEVRFPLPPLYPDVSPPPYEE